jgi:hypothetical protein
MILVAKVGARGRVRGGFGDDVGDTGGLAVRLEIKGSARCATKGACLTHARGGPDDRTNLHSHRHPKVVFRLVWRGTIGGVDCARGVTFNGKFQTLTRLSEVVFVPAAK